MFERFFNTAGPCRSELHYMLPPLERLPSVMGLIEKQRYFILHAPRQVGKTTALLALARELTDSGRYAAALLSLENGSPFPTTPETAEDAILKSWPMAIEAQLPPELRPHLLGPTIGTTLSQWGSHCPRPLVIFLDEIDSLSGITLLSMLRQLRSGYPHRPRHFPASVVLVGMRDVRDYRLTDDQRLVTASPFNIKDESLTLRNFTREEVTRLYRQHTTDTGQAFTHEAMDLAFELTQGQPWLVNALARQAVEILVTDLTQPITAEHIDQAREILIRRRDTHLDSLAERLREPRVRAVISAMLTGEYPPDLSDDDWAYVYDLGLVRQDPDQGLVVANPIYQQVIPRALTSGIEHGLGNIMRPSWLTPDGRLSIERLQASFLTFWRQHGASVMKAAPYHEAAPQLVMMAFLHRVVNGTGRLEREYAIGAGRLDLFLDCRGARLAIELKVWREEEPDPRAEGLQQLDGYLAGLGWTGPTPPVSPDGSSLVAWLVIFDRRQGQPRLASRTQTETTSTPEGRSVVVIRA